MHADSANPDDDIDRKSLRALRERFLGLNQTHLDALRGRLSEERRTFVDAVPLLLHSNHAALPGFVDFDMPCGIERYTPDRRALNAVRKMALSFVLERFVERRTQIQAVYVTQLPGDALEVSVCSAVATHAALTEKLTRLARYAADRGITLTTTLLDPAEEHAGRSRLRTPRPRATRSTDRRFCWRVGIRSGGSCRRNSIWLTTRTVRA
jgi:adenylate cyclase class 1